MEQKTHSKEETQLIAKQLIETGLRHNVIALQGDLGSGKTTFTQGFAQALGVRQPITSPTFMLLKVYSLIDHPQYKKFIHCDLYRVKDWDEIAELALDELWQNPSNMILIEWPERISDHLPAHYTHIHFSHQGEDNRVIKITDKN
ncbi:tRNA (adenosine(37)-N6)-threonylcarbamoyltransferase complex ATPase subunit type 1 TsaE [candidate division WWE3 bacterium]|nr:tRNA (adenosine(37)-N6)-threonylcarbamoyltransferase complex ATPase subunit type 1 TsaE [candidate division WWE3 bacterium]